MLKRFGNEYLLFLVLTAIYAVYLFAFRFASFTGIFVPYLFLCFVASNRNGRSPYVLMLGMIVAGAVAVSFFKTAFFIGTALMPALVLLICNKVSNRYSSKAVILSPLPVTIITASIFFMMPEIRAEIETLIVGFIEQATAGVAGANPDNLKLNDAFSIYYNQRYELASRFISLLPALMYVSVAFVTYITERLFYEIPIKNLLPLPDFLLLVVILSGLCLVITSLELHIVGWNGIVITGALYFMRGFDIVRYYMNRWRILLFMRAAIYVLVFIHYFLNIAVVALGFISIFKNLVKEDCSEQNRR